MTTTTVGSCPKFERSRVPIDSSTGWHASNADRLGRFRGGKGHGHGQRGRTNCRSEARRKGLKKKKVKYRGEWEEENTARSNTTHALSFFPDELIETNMVDGTSEVSNDGEQGAGQATHAADASANAVFAASGVQPHALGTVPSSAAHVSASDANDNDGQQQPSEAEYAVRCVWKPLSPTHIPAFPHHHPSPSALNTPHTAAPVCMLRSTNTVVLNYLFWHFKKYMKISLTPFFSFLLNPRPPLLPPTISPLFHDNTHIGDEGRAGG